MAALTITAASVAWVSGPQEQIGIAAELLTAGQPIYLDTTINQWRKCDASVAGKQVPTALCMDVSASAGQPFKYAIAGTVVNIGATIVKNTVYYLGVTGGIDPLGDITTGWNTVMVGIAATTANMLLQFTQTGISN